MDVLHLIDASSFIYRSFFALPPLKTSKGFPTGAIYGFLRALLSIMKSERPTHLAVIFDSPTPTKREEVYEQYKAGRPSMPDTLRLQIPVIKEILSLMGVPTFALAGYEADDLIASLSEEFSRKGFLIRIYTPDKDMLQLVGEKIVVINPMDWEVYDEVKVREKFGVGPDKLADFLALVGDKTDNIEGIKGVGPKRAIGLIKEFGGVEGILKRWEEFKKLYPEADREKLRMSYFLAKPLLGANLSVDGEKLKLGKPDMKKLKEKLKELEMKSIIKDIEKVFLKASQGTLF